MFPENAEILFMDTDRIADRQQASAAIAKMSVEVGDVPQAIAAEAKAVGAHAHSVFAHVEGILTRLLGARIAIGHHHLGE